MRTHVVLCAAVAVCLAAGPATDPTTMNTDPTPRVVHVAPVAPDILGVMIQEGSVQLGRQVPYEPRPGDRIEEKHHEGVLSEIKLHRDGQFVGWLTGRNRDVLQLPESFRGEPLDVAAADRPATYTIRSGDDTRYAHGRAPSAVSRKSKPNDLARGVVKLAIEHVVYLKLPEPLEPGRTYDLDFGPLNVRSRTHRYAHKPERIRSEAVHVNQHGFEPRDPLKRAFLSVWLGTGGAHAYAEPLPRFHLIDDASGQRVFSGDVVLAWPAEKSEPMSTDVNHNLTHVYRMDFHAFSTPGRYRVFVEGIGCSYPFDVRDGLWRDAFTVSVRGIYHHRSGIALGPPHTDFVRPRPHHPDDGVKIYQSRATLMDTSMGLNVRGRDSFEALRQDATDEVLPQAWGGMQDAGDWDRRVQHLDITRQLLELLEIAPALAGVKLNVPESGNELPDVMDEALWILDYYRRLQTIDGGVRGGVESALHPAPGDTSWTEILPVYAYAPDLWSSHSYASAAARAARALKAIDPERAAEYERTALLAMAWAEREYAAWLTDETVKTRPQAIRDERNLAALELYRLTRDQRWHELFREDSVLVTDADKALYTMDQRDALFAYARLDDALADPKLKDLARRGILRNADHGVAYAQQNAFNLTSSNKWRGMAMGFYSGIVEGVALVRGHALDPSNDAYTRTIVMATQFCLGANPSNLSFTTGLGTSVPRNVLHVDSRQSGVPAPPGITVYGPFDTRAKFAKNRESTWWYGAMKWFRPLEPSFTPPFWDWPPVENYVDMYNWVSMNEYTPQQTFAPTAYVWGYLAAQRAAAPR